MLWCYARFYEVGEARDSDLGVIGTPQRWYVVFNIRASTHVRSFLAFGRYKHVRAFGYVPLVKFWIFYDVKLDGTDIVLASDHIAQGMIHEWMQDGCIIEMPAKGNSRILLRLGFWCVPAIKHLIGLRSGALRPDRLRLDCLKAGGKVIYDGCDRRDFRRQQTAPSTPEQARPDVQCLAEPGQQ